MKHLLLTLALIFSAHVFSQAAFDSVPDNTAQIVYQQYEDSIAAQQQALNPVKTIDGIFETFFALVAFIPIAVQFLRRLIIPNVSGLSVQIFSWAIGIAITMAGWILHLGFLNGLSFWLALLYGAGACLAANGVFDTGIVTAIFGLFGKKTPT